MSNKPDAKKLVGLIRYLNFDWKELETPSSAVSDSIQIYEFIQKLEKKNLAVMILSEKGRTRSIVAATIYFIRRYGWTVDQTLEYIWYNRPDFRLTMKMIRHLKEQYLDMNQIWVAPEGHKDHEKLSVWNSYMNNFKLQEMKPIEDLKQGLHVDIKEDGILTIMQSMYKDYSFQPKRAIKVSATHISPVR